MGHRSHGGFTLLQVSVLVSAAAIVMVSFLPGGQVGSEAEKTRITRERMQAIETATQAFMAQNLRRPCPADGRLAIGDEYFGIEAITAGACITTGVAPSVNFYNGSANSAIVAGAVPTKSLALSDEFALDGFGRRFMYLVDKNATVPQTCHDLQSQGTKGSLQVLEDFSHANYDGGGYAVAKDYVMWALVSYGRDGHGAYPGEGGSARMDSGSTNTNTQFNAFVDNGFGASFTGQVVGTMPTSTVGDPTTYFDDVVWYLDSTKNTCAIGRDANIGFRISTNSASTNYTTSVTVAAGDINGDGIADLVVSNAVAAGQRYAYVIFGSQTGWPVGAPFSLAGLDGNTGFLINGSGSSPTIASFGQALAVGDVSGDGIDDIVLNGTNNAVIVFGATDFATRPYDASNPSTIDVSSLDGTNGLVLNTAYSLGGVAIGDIDGDGKRDTIVGSDGSLYVVYGRAAAGWLSACSGTPCTMTLASMTTAHGFRITTSDPTNAPLPSSEAVGYFTIAAGNVNGDVNGSELDDLLISGYTANSNSGAVYLLFGRPRGDVSTAGTWGYITSGTPPSFDITTQLSSPSTSTAIKLTGAAGDYVGVNVKLADLNNDAYKDLLILTNSEIYGYYGKATGSWAASNIDLTAAASFTIDIGTNLPSWIGTSPPVFFALGVGDIDGDSRQDLLLGTHQSASMCGKNASRVGTIYVIPQPGGWHAGSKALFRAATNDCDRFETKRAEDYHGEINIDDFLTTFRIDGAGVAANDSLGATVVADLNRDGKNDIVAEASTWSSQGAAYVLWGRSTVPWDTIVDLADPTINP